MLASLSRAGMASALLDRGTNVMNTICDRYEQSRHITVESEEAAALRQTIADIDAALHRRYRRCVASPAGAAVQPGSGRG